MRKQNRLTIDEPLPAHFICLVDAAAGKKRMKFFIFDEETNQGENIATNQTYSLEVIKEKFFGGKDAISMRNTHWQVMLAENSYNPDLLTVVSFAQKPFRHSEKFIAFHEAWQGCKPGEKPTQTKLDYIAKRMKEDLKFAIADTLGYLARAGVRGDLPAATYRMFFGIDFEGFRKHIASTFKEGFTFENHGVAWEIDHIKAKMKFDLTQASEILAANHYLNLRALSPAENRRKNCN